MSDKVAFLLTLLVAVAGTAFAVLVMDKSWPVAVLIAATPSVALGAGLLLKHSRENESHPE